MAAKFFDSMIGKQVSHVWRGHGSALFLEFGALTPWMKRSGLPGNPNGELSLMIEWSWRIEKPRSIMGGSWSKEAHWPKFFSQLVGAKVEKVEVLGVLPEIMVWLDNGLRVVSFMTADGQPSWAIIGRTPDIGRLFVKRGKLYVEAH